VIRENVGMVQDPVSGESGYKGIQNGTRLPEMVSVACRDIGIDCPFEVYAISHQELMRKFTEHVEFDHNLPFLSADILLKIKKAIKK